MEFKDEYMPLEEGLDKLVFSRKVASFRIVLFKNETGVMEEFNAMPEYNYGYQEMINQNLVDPDLELPGPNNKKYFK